MDKVTLKLHLGCNLSRYSAKFSLNTERLQTYNEEQLRELRLNPYEITGLTLGPRTVVEIFTGPKFSGIKKVIVNRSYSKNKTVNIGCIDNYIIFEGFIRSIKIWSYNYYYKVNTPKYCDKNSDCGFQEYCLCPDGQKQEEWCPIEKKRCMNMSHYLQSNLPEVREPDLIEVSCLQNELMNNKYLTFDEIKDKCNKCMRKRNVELVEGFGYGNNNIMYLIIVIIIFLFFMRN